MAKVESKNLNRLHALYNDKVVGQLKSELGYSNVMQIPKIEKIIINQRLGAEKDNSKSFNLAVEEIGIIAGQKPLISVAKKSVANFKLRKGQKLGAKVTLRGEKMYEFMDRLISIALPRVRDFNGLNPKSFDGKGNYSFGIKEQIVFPEIVYDKIEKIRGFDIIFVTTAKTDNESKVLLEKMGLPFTSKN